MKFCTLQKLSEYLSLYRRTFKWQNKIQKNHTTGEGILKEIGHIIKRLIKILMTPYFKLYNVR